MQSTASNEAVYTLHFSSGLLKYYTAPAKPKYKFQSQNPFTGTVYYNDPNGDKNYEIIFSSGKVSSYRELIPGYSFSAPGTTDRLNGTYETGNNYNNEYRIGFSDGAFTSYEVWQNGGTVSRTSVTIGSYTFYDLYTIKGYFRAKSNTYGKWYETRSSISCNLNGDYGSYFFATDYVTSATSGNKTLTCNYVRSSSESSTSDLYGTITSGNYTVTSDGCYEELPSGWEDYTGIKTVSHNVKVYQLNTSTGTTSILNSGGYFYLNTHRYYNSNDSEILLTSNHYVSFVIGRSTYYFYNGTYYNTPPTISENNSYGESVTGTSRWVQGSCYYYLLNENSGTLDTDGQVGNARLRFGNSASQAYSWWNGSDYTTNYPLQEIDYIKFSFLTSGSPSGSSKTLYYCLNDSGENIVCTSAPTVKKVEQSGTQDIYINAQDTPLPADRTFYFNAVKADGSTSLQGSSNGRTNYVTNSNSSILFKTDGTLQMVGNYSTIGIVRIKYSNKNGTSGGLVFANGYLIRDKCDSL